MLLDGRRDEASMYQDKDIESKEEKTERTHQFRAAQSKRIQKVRHNCGGKVPKKGPCPAKGKTGRECKKPNHSAVVSRSSKSSEQNNTSFNSGKNSSEVRPLQLENDDSEDDYMYAVGNTKARSSIPHLM